MCKQHLIDVSHERKQTTPVPEIEIHPISEESDLGVCVFTYLLFDQRLVYLHSAYMYYLHFVLAYRCPLLIFLVQKILLPSRFVKKGCMTVLTMMNDIILVTTLNKLPFLVVN